MDRFIDAAMRPVADLVSAFIFYSVPLLGADVPLIVVWLVAGGVFFTVYLRFVNVRGFLHAIRVVSGRYKAPGDPGEVSQFQALTTAVSGTVGIGNVAGVAVAISIGGPGATFWLIVSGLLGMSTKFAECTLGVLYRRENPDGSVSGGPMYYLERGLAERRWPRLGKALGTFYAASMVIGCLGIGSMFQSNQATAIVVEVTGSALLADNAWLVGTTAGRFWSGLVIVGGIRTIANTTVRLVPTMALLYVVSALVIIAHQRGSRAGRIRRHLDRRLRARGRRGRHHRRHHHRLPPRGVLERGGSWQRRDRACHRADSETGQRGVRGAARAVHRHRRHLHDDRARHHHHDLRPGARQRRRERGGADHPRVRLDPVLVAESRSPSPPCSSPSPR